MTTAAPIVFDRIAHAYDDQRAHPPGVSAQVGAAIAGVAGPGARVLELGIGTGRIAAPTQSAGCQVVGIDIADGMLRVAQAKGIGRLVRGNIALLPFAAGAFDAVLAVHVLHHLPDWRGGLAEAARLLRPGGELYIQTDVEDRAAQYREEVSLVPAFVPAGDEEGSPLLAKNPYGARSNREHRADDDGLPVWRMRWRRAAA